MRSFFSIAGFPLLRLAAAALAVAAHFGSAAPPALAADPPVYAFEWGTFGTGDGQFNRPVDVTYAPDGTVYVCDALNHRVQRFTAQGIFLGKFGSFGSGPGQFKTPFQIAFDSQGLAYVADQNNQRIQKFTAGGAYLGEWGSAGSEEGQFQGPWGIVVDGANNVYVTEEVNHRVQKFTNTGTFLTSWGGFGAANGQFNMPRGIGVGLDGTIYVSEAQGNRVQRFTPNGAFVMKWGTTGSSKGNPDPSPPGTFIHAYGLDIRNDGHVFVADWDIHPHAGRVQEFTADSLFVTQWRGSGSGPGEFWEIYDVDPAPNGLIYTADKLNHRIQVFTFDATALPEPPHRSTWAQIKTRFR